MFEKNGYKLSVDKSKIMPLKVAIVCVIANK